MRPGSSIGTATTSKQISSIAADKPFTASNESGEEASRQMDADPANKVDPKKGKGIPIVGYLTRRH
jgi:hypothetical protein